MHATLFPIEYIERPHVTLGIMSNGYSGTDNLIVGIGQNSTTSNPSNYWILWRKQFYMRQLGSPVGVRAFKWLSVGK